MAFATHGAASSPPLFLRAAKSRRVKPERLRLGRPNQSEQERPMSKIKVGALALLLVASALSVSTAAQGYDHEKAKSLAMKYAKPGLDAGLIIGRVFEFPESGYVKIELLNPDGSPAINPAYARWYYPGATLLNSVRVRYNVKYKKPYKVRWIYYADGKNYWGKAYHK